MKNFFKDLFEYNYNSNYKLIENFQNDSIRFSEKSHSLISHILNAQNIWNHRILEISTEFKVWTLHPAKDLSIINSHNLEQSLDIIESISLEKVLEYKTTTGQLFSNKVSEILFHIINHSTYHRGQIISDMKISGIEPLNTDYIFYKR